ncbi:MAG: hypothetical protein KIT07_02895 [Anaerolineales bacterium]|nr:hypothetical protein [Anaerolineales bacterium]
MNEFEVMKKLDELLNQLPDEQSRRRVLDWANNKHGFVNTDPLPKIQKPKKKPKQSKPKIEKIRASKDLNLHPKGGESFLEFIEKKQPKSQDEKNTAAIYFMEKKLNVSAISLGHLLTCYKVANWKQPADIANSVSQTASHKIWIEASNRDNLVTTSHGVHLIENELPRKQNKA